jgi:hypothetical protein
MSTFQLIGHMLGFAASRSHVVLFHRARSFNVGPTSQNLRPNHIFETRTSVRSFYVLLITNDSTMICRNEKTTPSPPSRMPRYRSCNSRPASAILLINYLALSYFGFQNIYSERPRPRRRPRSRDTTRPDISLAKCISCEASRARYVLVPRHVPDFGVVQAIPIRDTSCQTIFKTASDRLRGSAVPPARIW